METIESIRLSTVSLHTKLFLVKLACKDIEVYIFDSFSDLFFSRGLRWVRESNDPAYYEHMLEQLKSGTKVALVRTELIRDLDMVQDADQIRDEKNSWYETDEAA